MPITVTLTGSNPPDVLELGLTEERGQVLLDVVLAPFELTGRHGLEVKPYEPPPDAGEVMGTIDVDTRTEVERELDRERAKTTRLLKAIDATEARAAHYYDEATRLEKALRSVADERAVTRYLDPDEAREVGAALWHYAGEVER